MKFLFVLRNNEQDWADTLKEMLTKKGAEVIIVERADDALTMLRDPEFNVDHIIFGSMGSRDTWMEINRAATQREHLGRYLLTRDPKGLERKEIEQLGIFLIDKNTFGNGHAFMNLFFPEGRPKEMDL